MHAFSVASHLKVGGFSFNLDPVGERVSVSTPSLPLMCAPALAFPVLPYLNLLKTSSISFLCECLAYGHIRALWPQALPQVQGP